MITHLPLIDKHRHLIDHPPLVYIDILKITTAYILSGGGGDFGVARDNKYPDDSFVTKGTQKVWKGDR